MRAAEDRDATFAAVPVDGREGRDLVLVVVPLIARERLAVPAKLAGVGIDGHPGDRVEVVRHVAVGIGAPRIDAVPRGRLAGAPDDGVRHGVVAAGVPRRGATDARFPRRWVGPGRPRRVIRAGRDDVEGPEDLAIFGAHRDDAARVAAGVGSRHGRGDLAVRPDRVGGEALLQRLVRDLRAPEFLARREVEGHGGAVAHVDEHLAVVDHRRTAHGAVGDRRALVGGRELPDRRAVRRVEGDDAGLGGHEHDAVPHGRAALEGLAVAHVANPGDLEVLDVARVDLVQRAVAGLGAVAAELRPLTRRGVVHVGVGLGRGDRHEGGAEHEGKRASITVEGHSARWGSSGRANRCERVRQMRHGTQRSAAAASSPTAS